MILEEEERLRDDKCKSKDEYPAVISRTGRRCSAHLILDFNDDVYDVAERKSYRCHVQQQAITYR